MSQLVEYTEPVWRNLNMRALSVDEAYLILRSHYDKVTYLYALSDECYTCPYTKVKALEPQSTNDVSQLDAEEGDINKLRTIKMNIARPFKLKLLDTDVGQYAFENETALCGYYRTDLQEFGVYNLTLNANGTCRFVTDKEGVNAHLPILSVFLLVTLFLVLLKISKYAWRKFHYREVADPASIPNDGEIKVTESKRRIRSLDAFRGMAIVLMIFVNSGGGKYWWIEHATWNGLHVADVVFPSFLWIMGVCIPMSVKSQLVRGATKLQIGRHIIWRSIKMFAIGLCLNSTNGPQLADLRIMGVLQRFAIAYLVCALLFTILSKIEYILPQSAWKRAIYDLIIFKGEILVILTLIAIYLGIVFGMPVPNCPKGYLGPGGKHAYVAHPNCIGGATGYIDLQILGNAHIYQYPTAKHVYDSTAFDPEGVFGCLPTVIHALIGVFAGVILLTYIEWQSRIKRWIFWGFFFSLIGGILCFFSTEDGTIPVNKNLWSLSFVFVTSGLAFLMLSLVYFVIDVKHWWSGSPFFESGMNAIILYVGHSIMHKMLPWHWRIGTMNTHFVLLLESIWNTLMWVGIALYLNAKKFYYNL